MSEVEFIDIFAGNLRSVMEETGYGVNELAKDIHVDKGTISRYRNGLVMPSVKNVINMCIVMCCNLDDLIPLMDYVK